MEVIRNIETNDETELFFRGHASHEYVAEPTIFRKNKQGERSHLKNEKHLFNDIVTQCPEEFKDCQYTFEYLVKMQHYGLPTRLLDITSNALVALYFACCSLDDFMRDGKGNIVCDKDGKEIDQRKDGQVLVYRVRKDAIKNYNSDTVSVLSNLAQLDNNFELLTKVQLEYIQENKELLERMEEIINNFKFHQNLKELYKKNNINDEKYPDRELYYDNYLRKYKEDLRGLINSEESEKIDDAWFLDIFKLDSNTKEDKQSIIAIDEEEELIQPYLNQLKSYIKLIPPKKRFLHFIKREKSYFVDKIDSKKDVQKIVCVRAKLNNPRIIRQSGLFFLFGMGNTKGEPITFSEYTNSFAKGYRSAIQAITTPKILISGQAKKDIKEELRTLGISKDTLMPEMETVAKSIKDRYNS